MIRNARAAFEGSSSYYRSHAKTYINVGEELSPAQPIDPEPTTPAETPLISTEVAIVAVVAVACVIGVVSFWALRKRK